jgi:hypothetical protein
MGTYVTPTLRSHQSRAKLLDFRPLKSGSMVGFARVQFPSGLIVDGIGIHVAGSRAWASPPGRPWIEGGELVRDERGKPQYSAIISFANHGVRSRWSDAVLAAVNEVHPEILAKAEGSPLLPIDDRGDAP